MKRHLHNADERITSAKIVRVGSLLEQQWDEFFLSLLVANDDQLPLAQGESAWFHTGGLVANPTGDRGTGVTFEAGAGFGLKNVGTAETDDDERKVQPIFLSAAHSFQINASDVTNPRKDRVYMKPRRLAQNAVSVDVIDPNTKNISQQSLNTETAWSFEFAYVAGTPAASPVSPSAPSGFTDEDAIAELLVQPGSGAFDPGDITDLRDLLEVHPNLIPGITSFPAAQTTVAAPLADGDVQAALERHETEISNFAPKGSLIGKLEYVNTASVQLARGLEGKILIEIDGSVLEDTADLVFDLTADLDTGSEAASTWYYCYIQDSSGTMIPRISATGPEMDPANKVGYHPANTGWRFVGAFRNDASQNIIPFDVDRDGFHRYRRRIEDAIQFFSLSTTVPTNFTLIDLDTPGALPSHAREVLVSAFVQCDGDEVHFAHESLSGLAVTSNPGLIVITALTGGGTPGDVSANTAVFVIPVDATPQIAWGRDSAISVDLGGTRRFELRILGWR